jgi:hypothetical protein
MYYQIYKNRLLTANQDGADWRVLLDEGYLTESHATPQAALQDAIRWIESQGTAKPKSDPPTSMVEYYIYRNTHRKRARTHLAAECAITVAGSPRIPTIAEFGLAHLTAVRQSKS